MTEGEKTMISFIISFLSSIAAGIISYYVCKWLDTKFTEK